jgi:transcriptional regulator of arginine metabolism
MQVEASPATVTSTLQRALAEFLARVDRVQQLVLLRTGPGQAQLLAVAIDRARLPEVVGTVAGDDTILVIAPDARRAKGLVKRLQESSLGEK